MRKSSKNGHRGGLERHAITCLAEAPDAGENGGAACLRRGKRRPPAERQAWQARPAGWRESVCFGSPDIRTKARVAAVDCVGAIVRCASSPLTSAEPVLLIGGLVEWQPSWLVGLVSPRTIPREAVGHPPGRLRGQDGLWACGGIRPLRPPRAGTSSPSAADCRRPLGWTGRGSPPMPLPGRRSGLAIQRLRRPARCDRRSSDERNRAALTLLPFNEENGRLYFVPWSVSTQA